MDITKLIKSKAFELGFQKVGISSPEHQLPNLDYFNDWLNSGKNGKMDWLVKRKEQRQDVYKYFPEVKSVISVAINYFTGSSNDIVANGNQSINISNYAWGQDYHTIVKQKLNQLLDYIKIDLSQNVHGLSCTDTSPVMDKQWAQRAGLGWQGKHTILINDEYGSWMFLGELLLDIPLDYDEPFETNLCGSCTACVEACPTKALSEYQLDATKCISYLNVEYKDDFNLSEKNMLNNWVYGCDICQQVCPWNKKLEKISDEEAFQPVTQVNEYSLEDWLDIDQNTFKKIFKGSPIERIKYNRFMRNITAAKETQRVE